MLEAWRAILKVAGQLWLELLQCLEVCSLPLCQRQEALKVQLLALVNCIAITLVAVPVAQVDPVAAIHLVGSAYLLWEDLSAAIAQASRELVQLGHHVDGGDRWLAK